MKTADISVIVPVYNAVPYLPELIDGFRAQILPPRQLVFVNDGSTDGSSELLAELTKDMSGIEIIDQENQGQAVARNMGMSVADGCYLSFVDADDILAPTYYSTLYRLAEDEQLDIAIANAWNYHEGRCPDTLVFEDVADTGVISGEAWFQQRWLRKYLPHYCWMGLYRHAFVKQHGFSFPRADPHEDVVWVTETLLAAGRLHFVPAPLYRYRKKKPQTQSQDKSLMGGVGPIRHKGMDSGFYNTRALAKISCRDGLQAQTRHLLREDFVNGGCNLVRQILRLPAGEQKKHYLKRLNDDCLFRLLWENAQTAKHHWRIVRYYCLSRFA
jgi:glycosyltransferase involved in cell wall biosynthesis